MYCAVTFFSLMFVEYKPVITNTPSKNPVVKIKQQKERSGGEELNILFPT